MSGIQTNRPRIDAVANLLKGWVEKAREDTNEALDTPKGQDVQKVGGAIGTIGRIAAKDSFTTLGTAGKGLLIAGAGLTASARLAYQADREGKRFLMKLGDELKTFLKNEAPDLEARLRLIQNNDYFETPITELLKPEELDLFGLKKAVEKFNKADRESRLEGNLIDSTRLQAATAELKVACSEAADKLQAARDSLEPVKRPVRGTARLVRRAKRVVERPFAKAAAREREAEMAARLAADATDNGAQKFLNLVVANLAPTRIARGIDGFLNRVLGSND